MPEQRIVSPSQVDVLDDKGDNRLTLAACHPKYSARERIIVVAQLDPAVEALPPPPPATDQSETTTTTTPPPLADHHRHGAPGWPAALLRPPSAPPSVSPPVVLLALRAWAARLPPRAPENR